MQPLSCFFPYWMFYIFKNWISNKYVVSLNLEILHSFYSLI
jgi:hypothetical protein